MKLEDVVKKMSKRFDFLDGKFGFLEEKFSSLEGRFDFLEVRFDSLEGRFDLLEGRFDSLEGKFCSLEGQFDVVARMVVKNTGDIAEIKENMVTKDYLKVELNSISQNVDAILKLVLKRDQEMTFMGERIGRVENDVKKLKIVNEII